MDYEALRQTFHETQYCVIATSSTAGAPWLSAVFFNYDASYNIVWESTRDARHSTLIAENPLVAVYLNIGEKISDAVYAAGPAREVEPSRIPACLEVFLNGPHERDDPKRTPRDYKEGSPVGLYEARLDELYVLRQIKRDGYQVEERELVDLGALRSLGL